MNKIQNFINDNEFRFTIYDDMIHIINYKRIISLEEQYVSIRSPKHKIVIYGNQFCLIRLLKEELLLKGTISKIEVSNE